MPTGGNQNGGQNSSNTSIDDVKLTTLDSWNPFKGDYVQPLDTANSDRIAAGDFLSSETLVVAAGPAILQSAELKNLYPIGLAQNVQVQQQKNIQQIWEIGSRKSFFVPGRTMVSVAIARILFDGNSLMKAVYGNVKTEDLTPFANDRPDAEQKMTTTTAKATDASGNFFINLASAFFNKPIGLGLFLYDNEKDSYGGMYLEDCYIQTHSLAIAAAQTILAENITLRVGALKPVSAKLF